jgi:hypothetical protein
MSRAIKNFAAGFQQAMLELAAPGNVHLTKFRWGLSGERAGTKNDFGPGRCHVSGMRRAGNVLQS